MHEAPSEQTALFKDGGVGLPGAGWQDQRGFPGHGTLSGAGGQAHSAQREARRQGKHSLQTDVVITV